MFPLFNTAVHDTGGKFAAGVIDTGDTGSKFATGINDTSVIDCKFAAHVVEMVVHLDLQISPRVKKKFKMTLMILLEAWG